LATTVRRPRRARLRSRLVALVLLVVVPLAALTVVNLFYDRDSAAKRTYGRTSEIVSTGTEVIGALVDQTDLLLMTVARTTNPVGVTCVGELDAALDPGSAYRNLYAVDPSGRVVCTAVGTSQVEYVSSTEWFKRAEEREDVAVTAPAVGLTTGDPVMIVSHPQDGPAEPDEVVPGDPVASGVLAASLELQSLVAFTDGLELPPESVVQVLDAEGRVIARTSEIEEYLLVDAPLFPRLQDAPSGDLEGRGVDGVDRLYSYERLDIGGQTLYVMAGIARDEAYAEANVRLVWSLGLLALLGLGASVLAVLAGRSLVAAPIDRLRAAMADFRGGNIGRRAGDIGGPVEIVELGTSFDEMADEIQARFENQQRLLDQLEEASEAERQSISAGIHDETLQNLTAIGLRLQLLRRWIDDDQRRSDVDDIRRLLQTTNDQLRDLLYDLRPPEFDRIGLLATLRETLEVRYDDVLDDWSVEGELDPAVPELVQILLYRVAMQALANVREHAEANRVDITVASDAQRVTMDVTDDGRGFDVGVVESDDRPGHIGLRVMRDRAQALGGQVTILSTPGDGTTVRVEVPIRTADGPGVEVPSP
jgi:signal transduction histidine kinase